MNYCIGVDLGGTNISAGIVDLDTKKIIKKLSIKTNAPRSCEDISRDIVDLLPDHSKELCLFHGCIDVQEDVLDRFGGHLST